ncbi:hypothetical protein BG004_003750 [Podila humilis]|nr:hypothetical protein BG004_003750 [Podila humilis]
MQWEEYGDVSVTGRKVDCNFMYKGTELSNIEFMRPDIGAQEIAIQNRKNVRLVRCIQESHASLGVKDPSILMADARDIAITGATTSAPTSLETQGPMVQLAKELNEVEHEKASLFNGAHRRLALRYHPDKVNIAEVPDHETRFRDIAAAYEVLIRERHEMNGDPKKRQVYDKYGLMGVQMAGTEIGARLVEIESMLCAIFLVLSVLFILAILFFSFLSVRIDGKVQWNYSIVFTPLWILDAILIFAILFQLSRPVDGADLDEEEELEQQRQQELEPEDRDTTPMAQAEERRKAKIRERTRAKWSGALFAMVNVLLLVAFQALIVRKANDPTSISGPMVFTPYFILEGFYLLLAVIKLAVVLKLTAAASEEAIPVKATLWLIFESLWWKLDRLSLAVLIMLRIDGKITCSWGLVFFPLYLIGIKYLIQLVKGYRDFGKMANQEMKQQGQAMMIAGLVLLVVLGSLSYALIGLLAARLDGHAYSVSKVLIPVFIVLSILLCCSGCCLPCLLLASGAGEDEMMMGNEEGGGPQIRVVSPNMRIESSPATSSLRRFVRS